MKLIVFDVDGTLVDSQGDIYGAMVAAFEGVGLDVPSRPEVLSIVGLSLSVAMARLAPQVDTNTQANMVEGYKAAYMTLRAEKHISLSSPLYPGIASMLDRLAKRDDVLLGVATGKSRRGLDKLLQGHELTKTFVTEQVADHHPSKPHPAMLREAMAECGVGPEDTAMIGDTSFDMDMAQAAGCFGVGVLWGYHKKEALGAAGALIDEISELPAVLGARWGMDL